MVARQTHPPQLFEPDLLLRLTSSWGRRVAVKQDELDLDGHFDESVPDFPTHLVPLLDLPECRTAEPEQLSRLLSASWISYNAKTSVVEDAVILPACRLMLDERLPVRNEPPVATALHQTIIDEHFHILMCHNAVGVTRRRRSLEDLTFSTEGWALVQALRAAQAQVAACDRDLVLVAFALAAETTINTFLSTISTATGIQPMNRITTDMHRKDESGHAVIFRHLVAPLHRDLSERERALFATALRQGLTGFRTPDREPWVRVAAAAGIEIEAGEVPTRPPCGGPRRDTGPLRLTLSDLGLVEEFADLLETPER